MKSFEVLVVMEHSSDWPDWLGELRSGVSSRYIVVQDEAERLSAFLARAKTHTESLVAQGASLELCVIACNERSDPAAIQARRSLARTLAGALENIGRRRLLFTASERTSGLSRHGLSACAQDLGEELAEDGIVVSVRFGGQSARSHVAA